MPPEAPNNSTQKIITSLIVIIAVVLITIGVKSSNDKSKLSAQGSSNNSSAATETTQPSQTLPSGISSSTTPQSQTITNTSGYRDGTYSASASYYVPHGYESIKVTLTLNSGVISNSSVQNSESDPESASFQRDFTNSYKSQVVGKSLTGLNLFSVAGASDTTAGFNDALQQIRSQAQS